MTPSVWKELLASTLKTGAVAFVDRFGFGRELLGKICQLEDGTDFYFALRQHRVGAAFDPFDGFVHVADFPDPVAGDQFLGFGEGAVDDAAARTIKDNAAGIFG